MASDLKMPELNKLLIAGRLTRDPDLRFLGDGTPVCDFTIAVDRRTKTPGGEIREETGFFACTAWRGTAEWAGAHLRKGRPVVITDARLGYDDWIDKKTGDKRNKTRIIIGGSWGALQALDWETDAAKPEEHEHRTQAAPKEEADPQDEMPF